MIENKVQALKLFLDIDDNDIEDISWTDSLDPFTYGNSEYFILTDDEADDKAKEYILDTVWAFTPEFLRSHSGIDESVFKCLQEQCETANDPILRLIKDVDHFVKDAIACDGRGHFISSYDGQESYENYANETFYIYRVN